MNISFETAREVFGLKKDFSNEDLKKSFRKLSKITHPDNGGDSNLFRFIMDCKECLEGKNYEEEVSSEKKKTSSKAETSSNESYSISLRMLYENYYHLGLYFSIYNITTVYTDITISISPKKRGEYISRSITLKEPINTFLSANYVSFSTDFMIPKEFESRKRFYIKLIYMGKTYKFSIKRGKLKEFEYKDDDYFITKFKSYLKIKFC